ncbi:MAG: HAMP domain-containing sensor histidine kinase [Chakrabartia sp.]
MGLLLTGLLVSSLMRVYVTQGFHDELKIHIDELAALTTKDVSGQPYLLRQLSDPRYSVQGSGFYWEVRRDGFAPIRSPSLGEGNISGTRATEKKPHWAITNGPTGETIEYGMLSPANDTSPPFQLSIATDQKILEAALSDFNWPFGWALAAFASVMIGAGAIQIAFGLKPIHRMTAAISDIRAGKASAMRGNFPSEIAPIVNDLNALLEANAAMVKTARVQAGNLAHGLRTPLAILLDEADRLKANGLNDSAETLFHECSRMQRQIDYHLVRARTAAAQPTPGQAASIRETLLPILSAMRRLHAARNITLCCANLPDALVACDDIDLEEILANLLDNACKWARTRTMISWETDSKMILILIDDDGPGLPKEEREDAFEIGKRLDDTIPGTGLGLAIVRDMVQLYRGTIQLETSPLGGLRAAVALPLITH